MWRMLQPQLPANRDIVHLNLPVPSLASVGGSNLGRRLLDAAGEVSPAPSTSTGSARRALGRQSLAPPLHNPHLAVSISPCTARHGLVYTEGLGECGTSCS